MKNKLAVFAILGVMLLFFGCLGFGGAAEMAPSGNGGDMGMHESYAGGAASAPNIPQQYLDSSGRMVIKTGSSEVLVPAGTLEERYAKLKALVNQSGGFVYGTNYGETATQKYYYVTLKLPPSAFEALPQSLRTIGELKEMNTDSSDVTEQYIDIAVRIDNLVAERARLIEFYNRTNNVSELLDVEREVTRVQTEIDSLTAQKIYLERRSELATMTVKIYEETPLVDRTVMVPLNSLVSVFLQALSLAITIIAALMGFLIPGLVLIGILAVLLVGVKKLTSGGKKGK